MTQILMEIDIVLEPQEEGGYTVYVPSLPGCISQGETKSDSIINIKEALMLYLEPGENELILYRNRGEFSKVAI